MTMTAYEPAPAISVDDVINTWIQNHGIIEGVAAQYGIQTVFVWQPMPVHNYDLRYHLFNEGDGVVKAQTYVLMEDRRSEWETWDNFLWLADIQLGRHEILYVDPVHYTSAFSTDIAQHITDFVVDHKFVPMRDD
jgi:hypothetical protein